MCVIGTCGCVSSAVSVLYMCYIKASIHLETTEENMKTLQGVCMWNNQNSCEWLHSLHPK